uniref:Peptidase M12A domain-containing protein n=1 Tax=Plectus sambesii TaxID=2011161 RepID=A0A914VGC2_9BILA
MLQYGALSETAKLPTNDYRHRLKRSRPAELYNFNFEPFTEKKLWPDGIVSYRFDSEYPLGWMRDRVLQAFDLIQKLSCIRFQLVNENYKGSFVRLTNGDLCSSQVGRLTDIQEGQVLSLPAWCLRRPEGK